MLKNNLKSKHIKHWSVYILGAALLCGLFLLNQINSYSQIVENDAFKGKVEGIKIRRQASSYAFNNNSKQNYKNPHFVPTPTPTQAPTQVLPTPTQVKAPTPTPTAAPTPTPTPTSKPTTTPTPTPTPAKVNAQWGAYAGDSIFDITALEKLTGKSMNIAAIFVGWGSNGPFPLEFKTAVASKNKTLLIFWEPYGTTLDNINSGQWDAYVKEFATDAKNYGGNIILVPFHEMNGNWDSWDGPVGNNSAAKVISAWKRIHGLFSGAGNVKFGWAVNNVSVPNTTANAISVYYPGDTYVDYVGVDGFNFNDPWQSWGEVFNSALKTLQAFKKPIYIFSTASAPGSQKAQWIKDLGEGVKNFNLAGFVWFNQNKEQDWRINSDSNSLSAFKAILP